MTHPQIMALAASLLEDLRQDAAELTLRITEFLRRLSPDVTQQATGRAAQAQAAMSRAAASLETQCADMAEAGRQADKAKRLFQDAHGIVRDPKQPSVLVTLLFLMVGWLVESVFTTVGLYADGHVDLIPAMGFAVTFSTVNVGLGLAAGYCTRYFGYRTLSHTHHAAHWGIRLASVMGYILTVLVGFVMVFVGGRVRVTGGHEAIFDFPEVSFAATFDDGLALVIMVAAALSFAVAVAKGRSGFADRMAGYGDHAGRLAHGLDDEAAALAHAAQDHIDALLDEAEDNILDLMDAPDNSEDLLSAVYHFNARVLNAKDDLRVQAHTAWERACFIDGTALPYPKLNLEAFDDVLIDPGLLTNTEPPSPDLAALRQAHADASARITAAFAAYMARVRS